MRKSIFLIICLLSCKGLIAKQTGLERLMEGNVRYVTDSLEHPNRTSERREAVISKQKPFATIVGCADSRVSPEIIFDQGVGDLFVVRVAGNVIGPLGLDSVEYSVIYLQATEILVLGHENCGAVDAVVQGTTKDIEAVAKLIQPAVTEERKKKAPDLLEASIKRNAQNMRDYLKNTPVLKKYLAEKKIAIHAGYYNLQTGAVEILSD